MPRVDNRALIPRSAGKRDIQETGTDHAIYCSSKSVPSFDAKPTSKGHGGARLRADRTSDYLTSKQAVAIMLAALDAERIGHPFTRFVTVHWGRAGIPDDQAAEATGKLIKLMSDWARRRGAQILWAWVRENDAGKGSHLHLLIACPLPLRRMRRWLRSITGKPYRVSVVKTESIGGKLSTCITDPAAYHVHLFNVVAYICKGIQPDEATGLGLHRIEFGGKVIGKRSAVCQTLLALERHPLHC